MTGGLAAATLSSDVYALCVTLAMLVSGDDPPAMRAQALARVVVAGADDGLRCSNWRRCALGTSCRALRRPRQIWLAPDYWDEDTVVPFQNSCQQNCRGLGSGGIGQTFKVVELDAHSMSGFGAYVAKTVRHQEDGEAALRAYRQVRAQTTHPNLSTIHEIAPEWRANGFVALLKWIEGMPLQDWIGVLPPTPRSGELWSAEALAPVGC